MPLLEIKEASRGSGKTSELVKQFNYLSSHYEDPICLVPTSRMRYFLNKEFKIPLESIIVLYGIDRTYETIKQRVKRTYPKILVDECFFASPGQHCGLFYMLGLLGATVYAYGTPTGYNRKFQRLTRHIF